TGRERLAGRRRQLARRRGGRRLAGGEQGAGHVGRADGTDLVLRPGRGRSGCGRRGRRSFGDQVDGRVTAQEVLGDLGDVRVPDGVLAVHGDRDLDLAGLVVEL